MSVDRDGWPSDTRERLHVLKNRWQAVTDQLAAADLHGLLLTDPSDVRWLTGFSGSNGAALAIAGSAPQLATDGRYAEQAAVECPGVGLLITRQLVEQLLMRLRDHSVTNLCVDPVSMTLAQFRMLGAHPSMFGVRVTEVDSPLAQLRQIKDGSEIASLREACRISTEALRVVLQEIRVGMTELEVARMLELTMGELGASDRAFTTIVATGPNGGEPHHAPTPRTIEAGDFVTIDFGALVDGYHADCTRTVIVGGDPADWQAEIYQAVQQAAEAGRAAAVPGADTKTVDAAARAVISTAGFGEFFVHGLGHGVGLDIHESPMLGAATAGTLSAAVPITIEPGIYLPGKGGVRIEDTCLVGDGGLEIMTDFPRDLLRVD